MGLVQIWAVSHTPVLRLQTDRRSGNNSVGACTIQSGIVKKTLSPSSSQTALFLHLLQVSSKRNHGTASPSFRGCMLEFHLTLSRMVKNGMARHLRHRHFTSLQKVSVCLSVHLSVHLCVWPGSWFLHHTFTHAYYMPPWSTIQRFPVWKNWRIMA